MEDITHSVTQLPSSQLIGVVAPSESRSSAELIDNYYLCNSSLLVIKQLMLLIQDVQKHRGLSIGLLGGNGSFAQHFKKRQKKIQARVELIKCLALHKDVNFSEADSQNISNMWSTIKVGWQDDSVIENFHFHCHFVEQILNIIAQINSDFGVDIKDGALSDAPVDENNSQQRLFSFVCWMLPNLTEYLGRIRALSVYSATQGVVLPDHRKTLKYLCGCVQKEKVHIVANIDAFKSTLVNQLPLLATLKTYEFKLNSFIEKVMRGVVNKEKVTISGSDMFAMATEIIDVYWRSVNDGIYQLQLLQHKNLEKWCAQH